MGITDTSTVVVVAIALVAAVVACLRTWDRGTRPVRLLVRGGLVVGSNMLAVLLAGLLLNDTYGFYLSWGEALGLHAPHVSTRSAAGAEDRHFAHELSAAAHTGRGVIVSIDVPGVRSGVRTEPALVYLPPQYGRAAMRFARFPVIELLDGFPGYPTTWLRALHLGSVLDSAIASGVMAPTIVVLPRQNVAAPRDTECADVVGGPQVATYLTYDVRDAVTAAFRADADGRRWGIGGYSTGAYCASILAVQHPRMFAAAASIAGYDAAAHDATTGNLFGSDATRRNEADLMWWARDPNARPVPLLLMSTRQDRQSYVDDRRFDAAIAGRHWPVWQLTLPRGGHNMTVFGVELPSALHFLSSHLGGPMTPMPRIDGLAPHLVGASPP